MSRVGRRRCVRKRGGGGSGRGRNNFLVEGGQRADISLGLLCMCRVLCAVPCRGVLSLQVNVTTAGSDVHSGKFGGAIANPNQVLARLLASLHDPDTGAVAVPNFYQVGAGCGP